MPILISTRQALMVMVQRPGLTRARAATWRRAQGIGVWGFRV